MDYDFAISIVLKNASRLQNVIQTIYDIKHSVHLVDVIIYASEPVVQFLKRNQSYVFSTVNLVSNKNMYSKYKKVIEVDDSWIYDDEFIKKSFELYDQYSHIVDVCLISDSNYLKYLRHVVQQIKTFASNNTKYNVYILYDGFISDELNQLKDDISTYQVQIIPIPVINLFYGDMKNNICCHISSATNIRLLICDVIPKCVVKLLYLDCDIFIKSSIDVIYNYPTNGNMISGVLDFGVSSVDNETTMWMNNVDNRYLYKFNRSKYVNGGVLLFDMVKLRESNFHVECYDIYRVHSEFRFNDQDILNYYGIKHDCINIMPKIFNWQIGSRNIDKSIAPTDAVIVHYITKNKKLLDEQIAHDA